MSSGYTAVLCAADGCRGTLADELAVALRDCVGASRHGVLVVSSCTSGPIGCAARPSGPMLVVQPCDEDRAPSRPMIRIGPLLASGDVAEVVAWLAAGEWDARLLPARLVVPHRRLAGSNRN